jgi:hypothetical protein
MNKIPTHAPNIPRIAEILNTSTSMVKDLRARDPRFPRKMKKGYSVYGVVFLLRVRELERMTDEAFITERRSDLRASIVEIEGGDGAWGGFDTAFRTMALGILRDSLVDGKVDREEALEEALDTLRRHGGAA